MEICKKKGRFYPDILFPHIYEITPAFLEEQQVKGLILDLDNTIAPYEVAEPDGEILRWFDELRAEGFSAALVSNNHAPRVERFNRTLGLDAYPDSRKPRRGTLETAMKRLGVTHAETAMLGDQLLTDAYAGKHIGLVSIIVPPIKDKTSLFFKSKRLLERPFIRRYAKKNGYREFMSFWKIKE